MSFIDLGSGSPIVFLHGNPTSSFLWRNILPHLEPHGRLIAPDLSGMGDSAKLPPGRPDRYSFVHHANRLYELLEKLGVKQHVTFVLHDWGGPLGFLWAFYRRFDPRAVRGLAFMETLVAPFPTLTPELALLEHIRGEQGEQLVLQQNLFIEVGLPGGIIRNLTTAEMDEYRRPFQTPGEDRRAMLEWPRQIPLNGVPRIVDHLVAKYTAWLRETEVPKLWIRANSGTRIGGTLVDLVRSYKNLTEVTVDGIHFVQEDSPDDVGQAIANWIQTI